MVSREDLKRSFSLMGATLTDVVLDKCEELCIALSLSEEELAETWTAYACSKNADINPTVESLNIMERSKEIREMKKADTSTQLQTPKLAVYNCSEAETSFEDDILSSYGASPYTASPYTATPKAKSVRLKNTVTPDRHSSPKVIFSPASYSPTVSTPSTRYAGRTNAGSVLCSYGKVDEATWHSTASFTLTIKKISSVPPDACYMFDTLKERATLHEMNIKFLSDFLLSKAGIKNSQEMAEVRADEFAGCGRVCYVSGNHLTLHNASLEWFNGKHESCIIPMNLKEVPKFSLFPGQVIYAQATNPSRSELVVHKILSEAVMPVSNEPISFSNEGPLQVVIASGPYTQVDTMTYQPLEDFVDYLKKHRPHVAILIGPFVDAEHSNVKDGLLAETFDAFFEKQVENLMQSVAHLQTQVVLVASSRDIHHHPVFPTPAYSLKKTYANLHLLGDPCILDIEGLKIGVTSVDVLKHIGNEEIVNSENSQDRLGRLAKHVLMQNNFYPLYPPNKSVLVDTKLWYDYCHLPFTPHIMVLPSDLRTFIKEAYGCVLVNPEHLAKGLVGGCFARLQIQPTRIWDSSCVSGQVLKI